MTNRVLFSPKRRNFTNNGNGHRRNAVVHDATYNDMYAGVIDGAGYVADSKIKGVHY